MKSVNAYALLGLLAHKPLTGYEMKQLVEKQLTHFWKTSFGTIYPTMNRFIEDELVTVEKKENKKSPDSKIYTITEKGFNTFTKWLELDVDDFNSKDETLLKLFFSDFLPVDILIQKFKRSIEFNQLKLNEYSEILHEMKAEEKPSRYHTHMYLCVKKGVYLNEARIKWARDCIELILWQQENE